MSTTEAIEELEPKRPASKASTIGAVCKALSAEFPDISISKIRYLEDQRLLTPRRTPGGYRLYSAGDVSRLRTILRLQRDEFLPLRVIRQELASGSTETSEVSPTAGEARRRWRPNVSVTEANSYFTLGSLGKFLSMRFKSSIAPASSFFARFTLATCISASNS